MPLLAFARDASYSLKDLQARRATLTGAEDSLSRAATREPETLPADACVFPLGRAPATTS